MIRKGRKIFNIESDENMITEVDDKPRRAKKKQAPKYDDEDDFEMINEDEVTTKKSKRSNASRYFTGFRCILYGFIRFIWYVAYGFFFTTDIYYTFLMPLFNNYTFFLFLSMRSFDFVYQR